MGRRVWLVSRAHCSARLRKKGVRHVSPAKRERDRDRERIDGQTDAIFSSAVTTRRKGAKASGRLEIHHWICTPSQKGNYSLGWLMGESHVALSLCKVRGQSISTSSLCSPGESGCDQGPSPLSGTALFASIPSDYSVSRLSARTRPQTVLVFACPIRAQSTSTAVRRVTCTVSHRSASCLPAEPNHRHRLGSSWHIICKQLCPTAPRPSLWRPVRWQEQACSNQATQLPLPCALVTDLPSLNRLPCAFFHRSGSADGHPLSPSHARLLTTRQA